MDKKTAVVTGMGVVSPVGSTLDTAWDSLVNGQSGIGLITHFDASEFNVSIAGEVSGFNAGDFVPPKEQRRMDPFSVYGLGAAQMAVTDSGLDCEAEDPWRIGVVVGSGIGGLQVLQKQWSVYLEKGPSRFSPFMIPQMITNIIAGQIAIEHGFRGPNFCVTSACASAAHSIGEALRIIQRGEADVMLCGGAEASVCELGVGGFCALRALSTKHDDQPTKASRPFDVDRDGFVCGEGSGILVIESLEHAQARGARIYCEVAGYGRSCDANHITAPLDDGAGAARSMSEAMRDAGVNPEDVDYINAHGTSTQLNDKAETKAIKASMGAEASSKVMVSSSKSMTGHLLGAAAAMESFVCAKVIETGVVTPTINHDTPDPECDLDYVPNVAREAKVKVALNNSLGFGGHNCTLCFKAHE
jgi:3-oxoacyl-[acyl-carrier-protein] synthase II